MNGITSAFLSDRNGIELTRDSIQLEFFKDGVEYLIDDVEDVVKWDDTEGLYALLEKIRAKINS